MAEQQDIFMPQFALGVIETEMEDGTIVDHMVIEVHTASVQFTAALATKDNYRQVADKLAENIRRVGAEMRGPHKKLITNVKELPDGLRKTQGR